MLTILAWTGAVVMAVFTVALVVEHFYHRRTGTTITGLLLRVRRRQRETAANRTASNREGGSDGPR
jgi:hypothetical protein